MIQATIRMLIAPHRRDEILGVLLALAERKRSQPGCLSSLIYHDEQQEGAFMIEDVWRSQEDLDCHLRSDDYHKILLLTEMALEPPKIVFKTISHSAGIEIIERARGVKKINHGQSRL
jgi:quinol monooxygenase YgiN